MSVLSYCKSEWYKLQYPPIYWLCGFTITTILTILFTAHYLDVQSVAQLGRNPWDKISFASNAMFSVFIAQPFAILFISAALHIEHFANGWKQLYALPISRSILVVVKLLTILFGLISCALLLLPGTLLCGYILDWFIPEMEFWYYTPPIVSLVENLFRIFLALAGMIGLQYLLSLQFKSFLVPASFGVIAFIVGLILGSTDNPMALYFPYSYPVIARDTGMFRMERIQIDDYGWINSVEAHSLAWFGLFLAIALILEMRKNVK